MNSWQVIISDVPFTKRPSDFQDRHPDAVNNVIAGITAKTYCQPSPRIHVSSPSPVLPDVRAVWIERDTTFTFTLPYASQPINGRSLFRPITERYPAGTVIVFPPFVEWDGAVDGATLFDIYFTH